MVKWTPVHGERGQILLVTVLSMTVLLGVAALSIDASFMYDRRNLLHAAADAVAKSVAAELQRNSALSATDARNFASLQVAALGLVPGACGTVATGVAGVCLNPWDGAVTGPFAGLPGYVEATVSEVTPTFFGYVLGFVSVTPGGRAVAGISASPNCLVALSGLLVQAGALTLHNGCGIVDGPALGLIGGASISAASVSTAAASCAGVPNCYPMSPAPIDPLANIPPPSNPCPPGLLPFAASGPVSITTADLAMYCGGIEIDNAVVTFSPGVYYIGGPVSAKTPTSTVSLLDLGSGVTFFIAAGGSFDLSLSSDVTLNLRAPSADPYKGILFYQDRGNPLPATIVTKDSTSSLTGALYFPGATLTMNHKGAPSDCMPIVANNLTIENNMDLFRECVSYGGSPIPTITVAE